MRPPILFLTIAFGAGLYAGLDVFAVRGALYAVAPVLVAALWLARRAPLGAALGIMGVAGPLWGAAAGRGRGPTGAGTRGGGRGAAGRKAATVRPRDPAPGTGGGVDAAGLPRGWAGPVGWRRR